MVVNAPLPVIYCTNFKIISGTLSRGPKARWGDFGPEDMERAHDPDEHSESHPGHIPSTDIGLPM
jgi:hypothetical protein